MGSFHISSLAIPSVVLLISFLAFTSQFLFAHIDPCPLKHRERVTFNVLIACIFITYFRACFIDPGRIPKNWRKGVIVAGKSQDRGERIATRYGKSRIGERHMDGNKDSIKEGRWCRKCDASKPPRTHHCKSCMRCIPRMDHHCPWTASCVSHTTLPHFMRFLLYAVVTMIYLQSLLWDRLALLWARRHIPSTLGPTASQLLHLFALILTNSFTLLILTILLVRNVYGLALNTTTIEFWEIERHEAVLRRQRARNRNFGGRGEDVERTSVVKQEFPYDVGIWRNLKAGMGGSSNVLQWFWPFAATPTIASGLEFETNGFEDPNLPWPPPDPDHIPRRMWPASTFANSSTHNTYGTATRIYQSSSSKSQTPYHLTKINDDRNRPGNGESGTDPLSGKENRGEETVLLPSSSGSDDIINDIDDNKARINAFKARQHQAHVVSSVVRQRRQWDKSQALGHALSQSQPQQPQAQSQPRRGEIGVSNQTASLLDPETVVSMSKKARGEWEGKGEGEGEGSSNSSSNSRLQWRNADGERLADFGVDEESEESEDVDDVDDVDADITTHGSTEDLEARNENEVEAGERGDENRDDDDVPLGLLLTRRRKAHLV